MQPGNWHVNSRPGEPIIVDGRTGEHDVTDTPIPVRARLELRSKTTLAEDILVLLRQRVASYFYDDIRIIDRVARALLKERMHLS
jgi:hypothetical protein